jgi:PII-like signaling protein
MNGYQLSFYTEQNSMHGGVTVCEWLMATLKRLGIHGVTVTSAAQGIGHAGARHAAHLFKLADQPLQVTMAVTEDEAKRLMDAIQAEQVHLFYTRFPVEFGVLGEKPHDPHDATGKRFSPFHRKGH